MLAIGAKRCQDRMAKGFEAETVGHEGIVEAKYSVSCRRTCRNGTEHRFPPGLFSTKNCCPSALLRRSATISGNDIGRSAGAV
jgi:hypothetical protein